MTRLRFAKMTISSRSLLFATLMAIAATFVGCNKSQPPANGPRSFASPEDAGQAICAAAKSGDSNGLVSIFGPDAKELIFSGDPVQDKAGLDLLASRYDEMHRWSKLANGGMVLDVGAENYPFSFVLLKNSAGQLYFDSSSAKQEILARRIGGNELATADTLNAIADAQVEYFSQPRNDSHVR